MGTMTMTMTMSPWLTTFTRTPTTLSSLSLFTAPKFPNNKITVSFTHNKLNSSFLSPSSLLSPSSFSGMSLGVDLSTNVRVGTGRCNRLVVRAGKPALCLTKRSRSRKSLARTHGFRLRMRTTSGRATLKRRRDKGRKILCTKTNASSGKRS